MHTQTRMHEKSAMNRVQAEQCNVTELFASRAKPDETWKKMTSQLLLLLALCLAAPDSFCQGSNDWDTLWIKKQSNVPGHPLQWMGVIDRAYTGLAYDRGRDVLYIVNPAMKTVSGEAEPDPHVHIWDASTGNVKGSIGRSASGGGGELPVPHDTVFGGYTRKRFALYKVDVDDEGRIYACNLVAPLLERPNPPCAYQDSTQGPWKLYRWETPSATPTMLYATLARSPLMIAETRFNSEMSYTRWGDAFDVVGKRGYEPVAGGQPVLVDSTRIMVSGGPYCNQTGGTNREVNIFLQDRRPNRITDFRLAVIMRSSLQGIASHGIAATGPQHFADIWMDNNYRVTTLNNKVQSDTTWPQTWPTTGNMALSADSATGTGESGPLAYFALPVVNRKILVCADGHPTDDDPSLPNYNTTARLLDVTNPAQAFRFLSSTPKVGYNQQNVSAGTDGSNFVVDVDYKLELDSSGGRAYYITLFVLMSNNGIAAFRTKSPIVVPVELLAFNARRERSAVRLEWETAGESNNAGFDVQRSFSNGRQWESFDFVTGAGSTRLSARYVSRDSVTSVHISLGRVLYRLIQRDFDGTEHISHSVEAVFTEQPSVFSLSRAYPNPSRESATVHVTLPAMQHVHAELVTMLGESARIVFDGTMETGTQAITFQRGSIRAGAYLLRVSSEGAESAVPVMFLP